MGTGKRVLWDTYAGHRFSYTAACLAMQVGVAMDHALGSRDGEPKHIRVGINSAMADSAALARLLIAKGLVTEAEYIDAITAEMNAEVVRYEQRLSEKSGREVKLAPHVASANLDKSS